MGIGELTRESVLQAFAEFDRLGRSQFLEKYGYRPARSYYITVNGRDYDSKAIAGAAHAYLGTGFSALSSDEFSGGDRTVASKLRNLGFDVRSVVRSSVFPFILGQLYNRRQSIHDVYGGQQQGGISTPVGAPFVFLFTGDSGEEHGYRDGWSEDGSFAYCGEGQTGDQKFIRGNRAIRDHVEDGKDLLLFEALGTGGTYRFLGAFSFAAFETPLGTDRNNGLPLVEMMERAMRKFIDSDEARRMAVERRGRRGLEHA